VAKRSRERVEVDATPDLRAATAGRGWPEGLLERALEAGIPAANIWGWLHWRKLDAADMEARIAWHVRLTTGDLRGREATLADNDAFCELWANAPEQLGELEVTTLRGPNGFAQFRLQEKVNLHVIADGNVLVACCGWSRRNVWVGGQRVSVRYGQALRVHGDYRRQGFGDAVRSLPGAVNTIGPSLTQYDIMRSQNFAVVGWWEKHIPGFFDDTPQREGAVPGIPVSVAQLPARAAQGEGGGIRAGRPEDLGRCAELVNRTHAGLDLFRPYTVEFLEDRLDEGYWGARAPWFPPVYGWDDYLVVESRGRVVACAGLWDRGRDLRERLRHRASGEERIVSHTALMDWGYAEGAEGAMVELVDGLLGRSHTLGRSFLLAPLDHTPSLAARLEGFGPLPEVRSLRWGVKEPALTRPYTDLAYW
jgi:hypothetical protein